eukprot:ANDGO_01038.mRNA.1 DNA repair protein RAD5
MEQTSWYAIAKCKRESVVCSSPGSAAFLKQNSQSGNLAHEINELVRSSELHFKEVGEGEGEFYLCICESSGVNLSKLWNSLQSPALFSSCFRVLEPAADLYDANDPLSSLYAAASAYTYESVMSEVRTSTCDADSDPQLCVTPEVLSFINPEVKLFRHQLHSLSWMMRRESIGHPRLSLLVNCLDCRGRRFQINIKHGRVADSTAGSREDVLLPVNGGILADDMGTGKTIVCLAACLTDSHIPSHYTSKKPRNVESIPVSSNLIVVPSVLMDQWKTELSSHFASSVTSITATKDLRTSAYSDFLISICNSEFVFVSLEDLSYLLGREEIRRLPRRHTRRMIAENDLETPPHPFFLVCWKRLVFDEAFFTNALVRKMLLIDSRYRWCVSGTPIRPEMHNLSEMMQFLSCSHELSVSMIQAITNDVTRERSLPSFVWLCLALRCVLRRSSKQLMFQSPGINIPPQMNRKAEVSLSEAESIVYALERSRTFGDSTVRVNSLRRIAVHPGLSLPGDYAVFSQTHYIMNATFHRYAAQYADEAKRLFQEELSELNRVGDASMSSVSSAAPAETSGANRGAASLEVLRRISIHQHDEQFLSTKTAAVVDHACHALSSLSSLQVPSVVFCGITGSPAEVLKMVCRVDLGFVADKLKDAWNHVVAIERAGMEPLPAASAPPPESGLLSSVDDLQKANLLDVLAFMQHRLEQHIAKMLSSVHMLPEIVQSLISCCLQIFQCIGAVCPVIRTRRNALFAWVYHFVRQVCENDIQGIPFVRPSCPHCVAGVLPSMLNDDADVVCLRVLYFLRYRAYVDCVKQVIKKDCGLFTVLPGLTHRLRGELWKISSSSLTDDLRSFAVDAVEPFLVCLDTRLSPWASAFLKQIEEKHLREVTAALKNFSDRLSGLTESMKIHSRDDDSPLLLKLGMQQQPSGPSSLAASMREKVELCIRNARTLRDLAISFDPGVQCTLCRRFRLDFRMVGTEAVESTRCRHALCSGCIQDSFGDAQYVFQRCPCCHDNALRARINWNFVPPADISNFGSKLVAVLGLVRSICAADPGAKIIVFSHWSEVLELLEKLFNQEKIRTSYLKNNVRKNQESILHDFRSSCIKKRVPVADTSGNVHASQRSADDDDDDDDDDGDGDAVENTLDGDAFLNEPIKTPSVLLLTYSKGAYGLNLIGASHVLLVEPAVDPFIESQAVSRVYRIGQQHQTFVHRLVTVRSVESKIHSANESLSAAGSHAALSSEEVARRNEEILRMEDTLA